MDGCQFKIHIELRSWMTHHITSAKIELAGVDTVPAPQPSKYGKVAKKLAKQAYHLIDQVIGYFCLDNLVVALAPETVVFDT